MNRIFISYVEEDGSLVRALADHLEQIGYPVWMYERNSVPGPSYLRQTGEAIEAAPAMILILSSHSLESRQVGVEIVRAHESQKPILPVLVDISYAAFQAQQPEWRQALGAAVAIRVPDTGIASIFEKIHGGLESLKLRPSVSNPTPVIPKQVPPRTKEKVFGIDLGTTYSVIATLDEKGKPFAIPNSDGGVLTPSAVYFAPDGTVHVGQVALEAALETPERAVTLVKRRMGYSDVGRTIDGQSLRPETVSALILKKLARDAEQRFGTVRHVVITVPAYFDVSRRQATRLAGQIAGLNVLDIVDEPVAAALAYATAQQTTAQALQRVLVYDLGGGTFDASLVRFNGQRFQTLAIDGDVLLGGADWDDCIAAHIAEAFATVHGCDPRNDPQARASLLATAEDAKRKLTKLEVVTINYLFQNQVVTQRLTRTEFESLTADLLMRTRFTTQSVLRSAGCTWDQIDRTLLVGGSTHMPMIAAMLREVSGKQPDQSLAVSEIVARGAALHAGMIFARSSERAQLDLEDVAKEAFQQMVQINVNGHSFGVEVVTANERRNDILIPKHTQLPTTCTRLYYTAKANQSRVRVRILQGEATQAEWCIPVGECWIDDLPADLPKGTPISVRCSIDSNSLIEVSALEPSSGRAVRAVLHPAQGGLTDAEVMHETAYVAALSID